MKDTWVVFVTSVTLSHPSHPALSSQCVSCFLIFSVCVTTEFNYFCFSIKGGQLTSGYNTEES